MFGLMFMFFAGIILMIEAVKKGLETDRRRDEARRFHDDSYFDAEGKERLTENNHYGGLSNKYYWRGEELKKLNDELNYIEEGDQILRDFVTGKELKNYSRERRIENLNKFLKNPGEKSVLAYPPYEHKPHDSFNDICKGYRYIDIQTHDLYVIRRGKYGEYFMRIKDGRFIRAIDRQFVGRWKKVVTTEIQANEIEQLNREQEQIKRTYVGRQMYEALYRNDDHIGIKTIICDW